MLMADMTESERETIREVNRFWLPEGAELLELVDGHWDHNMALLRMPDGSLKLCVLGDDDPADPFVLLEERIAAYERAAVETGRFLGIARAALGLPTPDRSWACLSCGRRFGDPQPVCPACGAKHE